MIPGGISVLRRPELMLQPVDVSKRVYRGDWAAAVVRYFLHKAEKTCQQRMGPS